MEALKPRESGPLPAPKKYPDKLRDRAARMVFETRERTAERSRPLTGVAQQLGINPETLRNIARQAEVDAGRRPGTSTEDRQRIPKLEREVFEHRRANSMLKSASALFAAELDRPQVP
jgi:transposase